MHRGEVFGCLGESRFVCGVARIRVSFGVGRMLSEVNQTGPHQTMEICDPKINRLDMETDDYAATRTYIVQQ